MSGKSDAEERSVEKPMNKNYEADVKYSMQYTRWLLTILGMWPSLVSDSTRLEKLLGKYLRSLIPLYIAMHVIPIVSILFVRECTGNQTIMILAPIIFRSSSVLKNLLLMFRLREIKVCVEHMATDWKAIENERDREIMLKHLRVGRRLTITCVTCLYCSTIFYNSLPFVVPRKLDEFNETIRPIILPGIDIYVDLNAGHNYEIVILTSCISIFCVSTTMAAICNLAAVLVCHACGQIQIVMSRLANLIGKKHDHDTDHTTFRKEFSFIIRTHVRALGFAKRIDDTLQEVCFSEVVQATIMLCMVAYMLVTDRKNATVASTVSFTTLLVSYSFNIFIYCRIGELLKEKCEAVGTAAYMTEWYRLQGKSGIALVMIITVAHYPRRLTAGRVIELTILTFGSIMKTSIGYANMLRTMTE